jgi:fumarate reductase subunit C
VESLHRVSSRFLLYYLQKEAKREKRKIRADSSVTVIIIIVIDLLLALYHQTASCSLYNVSDSKVEIHTQKKNVDERKIVKPTYFKRKKKAVKTAAKTHKQTEGFYEKKMV